MNPRLLLGIHLVSTAVFGVVAWVWWERGAELAAGATLVYPTYLWSKIAWRAWRRQKKAAS